ncbi:hypothetical protein BDY21DRAFT_281337 [Lineolata rhizophorae]|uniref:Glycosyl transferase CAP10 domain-containing protein n=1 Tax=Lineolata rhizophorae TaxID=578093 RepID=A0A6A6P8G6_9PEZI|nr:hypothetical protein BDY21DRAFT_281337 [Lineolata rhizophorae]
MAGKQLPQHPIQFLAEKLSAEFEAMLRRQSKTVEEAISEYRRRYNRDPPAGFDKWFDYAKAHDSLIIDDFDSIGSSLEPLWKVEPAVLRESVHNARTHGPQMGGFAIQDGEFQRVSDWMAEGMRDLLLPVVSDLPDVEVAINLLDEPRVLLNNPRTSSNVKFDDHSHQHAWSEITDSCIHGGPKTEGAPHQLSFENFGLSFIGDIEGSKDLCLHTEYHDLHGFFISPTTLLYTERAVPIFSQAKPSTFGDIVYPSIYYIDRLGEYNEDDDLPWEDKQRTLYWAGSTTGSQASDENWHHHHRQRFIAMAQHLENTTNTFLTEVSPGNWQTYKSREILSSLYDAKFTAIIQCSYEQCAAEKSYFQPGPREDKKAGYKSRFVFDIDGNSFSGRYYTLLSSRSVVMKQTIFQEWHDDRLFPWVHYVPVSLQMDELPESVRFLALTEVGDAISRRIADAGRDWSRKSLRKEDHAIYLYRLMLEYARVLRDDR